MRKKLKKKASGHKKASQSTNPSLIKKKVKQNVSKNVEDTKNINQVNREISSSLVL